MKTVLFILLCAGMLVCSSPASAARALQLSGDYTVYIWCTSDIGDFCNQGSLTNDTFTFNDDSFEIGSFGGGLGGAVSSGDYSSSGTRFTADFTGFDGADQYTFDIPGWSVFDFILAGTMDITFEENAGLFGGDESGRAFFLATRG